MNMAHFHLVSVHLPIVAIPLLALLLVVSIRLKKPDLYKAALVGVVLVAIFTVPVFLSGEEAEEVVENLPSMSENQIEVHEDAATIAFVIVCLSGLISLMTLLATKFQLSWARYSLFGTVVVTLISTGTLIWAANEGGKIRHTEILKVTGMSIEGRAPGDSSDGD